ncbi:DUF2613 family protein [Streptacidiphilus jiangxiensis]|uniref:Uncharacterized protein n=1 Tax=Streptacidiphilus jiangxiensis TaxID=235985 RepID=A0A1H7ZQ03_STRJI|nr:DUF2613 family protein [Streptacidiphilus jiangxiensis]SEM59944.1 Protein of unknown function [Streptacidiphilus jiangxiensis]
MKNTFCARVAGLVLGALALVLGGAAVQANSTPAHQVQQADMGWNAATPPSAAAPTS